MSFPLPLLHFSLKWIGSPGAPMLLTLSVACCANFSCFECGTTYSRPLIEDEPQFSAMRYVSVPMIRVMLAVNVELVRRCVRCVRCVKYQAYQPVDALAGIVMSHADLPPASHT